MSDIRESVRRLNEFCDDLERLLHEWDDEDERDGDEWEAFLAEHPELR